MEDPGLLKRRPYTAVSRATQRVTLLARGPLFRLLAKSDGHETETAR